MLFGEYNQNMDAKGRIIVPAKLRDGLGEIFYITKGLGGCLWAFSQEAWSEIEKKVSALPLAEGRNITRFLFSGAMEAIPDVPGRVLLPPNLRKHANLTREVTFLGTNNRMEIWDTAAWNKACEDFDEAKLEEQMEKLGF